ncbi:MAG TPA: pyridoxamine 5'-phosphate oxidase family protein [Methylomirabilota bacterium]|nr:pyridoxamine 5'-phosphate oxidase family protein [Methylomirabilota bacterium]
MRDQRPTFELVLSHLRKRDFAVLSTVSQESKPHSVGVNYGVSRPGRDLVIYVMTRKHLQKARNIAQNPNISLVVPLTRRLMWFLPPPTIQLRGHAEIVDWTDDEGTEVFRRFWLGRRILEAYHESHRRGETRICFLKITPDPVVSTYMVGFSIWQLRKRMESGAAKVVIPPEYRSGASPSPSAIATPSSP